MKTLATNLITAVLAVMLIIAVWRPLCNAEGSDSKLSGSTASLVNDSKQSACDFDLRLANMSIETLHSGDLLLLSNKSPLCKGFCRR